MWAVRLAWLSACLCVASSRRISTPPLHVASPRRLSSMVYEKMIIPDDSSVAVFLSKPGLVVKYFYLLQKDVESLSFTVTPCSGAVAWELDHRNSNQTGKVEVEGGTEELVAGRAVREQRHRVVSPASRGLYTVLLTAAEAGWVELYATFMGPPSQLWPPGRILVKSRPARGNVFLRWPRTTIDPDLTEYVLVLDKSGKEFASVCQAREYQLNASPDQHFIMERTGRRTSWLVRGLEAGRVYRAAVFAVHTATNFSYRYAEAAGVSYSRPKARPLPDGVTVNAELRSHDPSLLYRYKVRREGLARLELALTVCGAGALVAELRRRPGTLLAQRQVRGHSLFAVDSPPLGAVYLLRLSLPPDSRAVSAQVSAQGEEPLLPEPAELHEFRGLRGCRDVTLGWVPVPGEATYCLRASQSRPSDPLPGRPDQCAVDQQLNSLGYSVLQCSKIHSQDRAVVSERLTNLRPGKQYDIQLSVKRANSRRLSYKLLRVRTKSSCNYTPQLQS